MFFDTLSQAKAYAKGQTQDTRRKHKVAACNQWRFNRLSGDYMLVPCYTVVLA